LREETSATHKVWICVERIDEENDEYEEIEEILVAEFENRDAAVGFASELENRAETIMR